ncbi:MAG TPA: DUF885 domain-containing protein, partial [Acidimicrobiales bacterium]|nr:DUF885 domain-containing protein [Acidimicrobiales bacterium]
MPARLQDLLDTYLDELWEEQPVAATVFGVDGYDDRLGDLSADAHARRERRDDERLAEFEAVTDDGLSLDDRIDRDLVLSAIRGRQIMRDWADWKRDPATYLGPALSGVFTLFLQRLHDDAELTRCASARLHAVPELLAQGRQNLDPEMASTLSIERALGQCAAGAAYARTLVPAEVPDGPLRAELAEAGEVAAAAFEEFHAHLTALAGKASGQWAIGEERYSRLLKEKELLGYGAADMRERGRAAFDELDAQMTAVARSLDDGKGDWRAVMEGLNADHPPTPEAMRSEYEEWTEKARQFLIDHELVTLPPGEKCIVAPSPPFQRPVLAVASYSTPPAFRPTLVGHFFVPYPPDGASESDVKKRLETNSRSSIPTIAVHEAYPGHHWHLTWMQQNPRRIRQVVRTSYFVEGWGLYAERLLHEQGFFADPRHELGHLDARIFRAARIIVDTSLHMGEMDVEEAVAFMQHNASLSEPTARAEVKRYCSWPTQASSYLTGSIEIERIRAAYLAAGKGDLRSFNDAIAGSGGLPIGL